MLHNHLHPHWQHPNLFESDQHVRQQRVACPVSYLVRRKPFLRKAGWCWQRQQHCSSHTPFLMSIWQPAEQRHRAISVWPWEAVMWRAVQPSCAKSSRITDSSYGKDRIVLTWFWRSSSLPAANRLWTMERWLPWQASWSAVFPFWECACVSKEAITPRGQMWSPIRTFPYLVLLIEIAVVFAQELNNV